MKLVCIFVLLVVTVSSDHDFLASNNAFSAAVYKRFAKNTEGNFVLSPFSAEVILSLTEAGCKNETASQIHDALFVSRHDNLQSVLSNVLPSLSENKNYTLTTANKIYVQDGFPVRSDFRRTASLVYGADCENVDFRRKQQAAKIMNTWVENKTNRQIKNLIDRSNLNANSRVVLVNSLYLKANWSKTFPVAYTKSVDFHLSQSEAVKVNMMLQHEKMFNYFESKDMQARFLELPFKGEDASMVVVLPNEIEGLPLLERQMKRILKPRKFTKHLINVGLPRFKVETSVELKSILRKMGIVAAFESEFADLSGIAGAKGDLVVDKVAQKNFIEVSEQGVEAAAATYYLLAIPMSAPAEEPKRFRVDRPFIFYIKVKDVVVFVGRVTDPRNQ